ncbi:MAG: hypothetical protein HY243_13170 [Proteobacteria bacterium]|nr:hypothetical protein [Pseudomonadota bacterium]
MNRSGKEPLLRFILDALRMRSCSIVFASEPNRAPFYVVFETPDGNRHGLLAYAFFANSKPTKNRPRDEHRFQIKYGGNLKGVLEVAVDPRSLITTIFLGIDTKRSVFVAADPLMNAPAPMSRSIEFKANHVDQIVSAGWTAWERERHAPKTKSRPSAKLNEDLRTETLVGGRQDRILDLILLERAASGLDPGERHLVADKLSKLPKRLPRLGDSHPLLDELGIESRALLDLIDGASRLKMAVRGWVAERHLAEVLAKIPGITDCKRLEGDGRPDISLRWKGGPPILVECKNTLRETYADGRPKVDFQRTRAAKGNACSRYYKAGDFPVLAACLHPITEKWEFRFALTAELPPHKTCQGRITNSIGVSEPVFTERPEIVFTKCS